MATQNLNDHESLRHQARHDTLTGLLNRHGLAEELQSFINEKPGRFGLLLVDLDNVKRVNDTEGHDKGDDLLKRASDVFRQTLRQHREDDNDVVATGRANVGGRVGGDEFVLLISGADSPEDLDAVRERLRKNMESANISAAIGGALHQEGLQATDLMASADNAMYVDKVERKIANYSPAQLAMVQHIGELAIEHDIDLRDMPTILPGLETH
jgi:diguanylate cyclase (GGDEF)-like protein